MNILNFSKQFTLGTTKKKLVLVGKYIVSEV